MVNQVAGGAALVHWEKWEPIVKEYRKIYGNPDFHSDWEYFYNRVKKHREIKY
jgi:hypothetical protein